jgi:hypothetical protein
MLFNRISPVTMSPTQWTPFCGLIEPLETRIAPAALVNGVIQAGADNTDYTAASSFIHSTHSGGPNFDAGDALGANFVGGTNTFYVELTAGGTHEIALFNLSNGFQSFVNVHSGTAIAFFVDKNSDGKIQSNELTGLSLSKGASVDVAGDVDGDVVTNFNGTTIDQTHVLAGATISHLSVHDVGTDSGSKSIIAGGTIKNVKGNDAGNLFTGNAADGYGYDFNSTDSGGGAVLAPFALSAHQAGASISSISLTDVGAIHASDGGAGAVGGAISNVTITSDTTGLTLQAGAGGAGISTTINGGKGGAISNVFIQGPASSGGDSTPNDSIQILGGAGGEAFAGSAGHGGLGGNISKTFVGFDRPSKAGVNPVVSAALVADSVLVKAGDGGIGATGGNAGKVTTTQVIAATPDAAGHEIEIAGGVGGANNIAGSGKSGAGGQVTSVLASDLDQAATAADIFIHGGDAGVTLSSGGNGGAVKTITLTTFNAAVQAGSGADGTSLGGKGSSITGVQIISNAQINANTVVLNAGHGGDASSGAGGIGGSITTLRLLNSDLTSLILNDHATGTFGDGGAGASGKGGAGGKVSDVQVEDIGSGLNGAASIFSGVGGAGSKNGGKGGAISGVSFAGVDLDYTVHAGAGGNSTSAGNGGQGGAILNSSFASSGTNSGNNVTGDVEAGAGGAGVGSGKGGAGGVIQKFNGITDGAMTVLAGTGGSGGTGAAGKGGSLINAAANSQFDSTTFHAGNAGSVGGTAGAGGSISHGNVIADVNVDIAAGNGSNGGTGGAIKTLNYSGTGSGVGLEPTGTVALVAGTGSGTATKSGAGGSISNLTGFAGDGATTLIRAGDGNPSTTATGKASVGGSISNLTLNGGGTTGAVVRIQAGDAGNASALATGAKGGNVTNVIVGQLESGTILQSIAAGNGGAGTTKGGAGGSITHVFAPGNDIGDLALRETTSPGPAFGFSTMGGLFAGMGGAGPTAGAAGSVTNITAEAIGSIVAGRLENGDTVTAANFATNVNQIVFSGATPLQGVTSAGITGSFTNYDTANFAGGIVDPTSPTGGKFVYTDTNADMRFDAGDATNASTNGFIAAITFVNNSSIAPLALLTPSHFIDLNDSTATY